jgi:hypothetical protein
MKFIIKHLAQSILSIALATIVTTVAHAAPGANGADGSYKIINLTGKIKAGQETTDLGPELLAEAIASGQSITIQNGRINFGREFATGFVNGVGSELAGFKSKVTGPTSLRLKPKGSIYIGKAASPLVVTFSGRTSGVALTGKINFNSNATVKGDILTFVIPIAGNISGGGINLNINGKVTFTAMRGA